MNLGVQGSNSVLGMRRDICWRTMIMWSLIDFKFLLARLFVALYEDLHLAVALLTTTSLTLLWRMNSISLSCCLYFPKSIACHNNPLWFCIAFVKSISIGFCMGLNRSNSSRKISINCFWGGRHRRAGVHSWWWWVECREYREYDFGLSVYTGSIIDTCGDIVFSMRCHSNYYALVRVIGVRATSRNSRE